MLTDIRVRGQLPAAHLRASILDSVVASLGRFGADVTVVHVRITDVHGPRRGVDMHALVSASGPRIGSITVEDLHEAPALAVASALERIGRAIQRDLDRLRDLRRKRNVVDTRSAVSS